MQKKIAAIHDVSGFGRCSLTVALPILSAAGHNCAVLPTAVLSTHTGGLGDFTYRDLTDDIMAFARHWQNLGLSFDAMYSGFLGSDLQVEILMEVFKMFGDCTILVDPVMADNGSLYKTFHKDFPIKMAELCAVADIITPNITEASLLTGIPYCPGPYTKEKIDAKLHKLADIFGKDKQYVITGVFFDEEELGAAAFEGGKTFYCMGERTPQFYPGTGDIFASVLLSALVGGADLFESCEASVNFTAACAKRTFEINQDPRYGVQFELELEQIVKLRKQHKISPNL